MHRKSLHRIVLVILVVAVTTLIASCREDATQNRDALTVGVILPQTGAGAVLSDYIKKGLDLAAEELNSRTAGSIKLVYGDSQNSPREGVTVFRQMTLTNRPPVVIVGLSSVTKAVAPLAKPDHTVVIGTAVCLPNVTEPSEYVFRVYPEAHGVAGVIANYAIAKYKTAAVAYINDDFGASSAEVFGKIFEGGGGKVLLKEPYNLLEKDFRAQWQKIKSARPECVWIVGYGPAYAVLVRQMREAEINAALLADMTLGLPITLKTAGDAAEGAVYVDGPMSADFVERYTKKYGDTPTSYAGYAYDIIMILDAVRKEQGTTPEAIRDGLARIKDYPGAMGPITLLPNRDAALTFVLMRIENGHPTPLRD